MLRSACSPAAARDAYAARVLLDVIDPSMALEVVEAGVAVPVLELPGGATVDAATLGRIFAAASLERELATGCRDALGRFDESAIAWDTATPWIDGIAAGLALRGDGSASPTPPAPRRFAVHITHDIDRTTLAEPYSIAQSLRSAIGGGSGVPLRTALAPRALLRVIESLLDLERARGVTARYFLMTGPYGLGRHSTRTDVRWASWRAAAGLIRDAGMAVGLHSSFAASDRDTYATEKDALQQAVGCAITTHRSHYLRFDTVRRCAAWEAAGLLHDFSVGYGARIGFRSGCAGIHRAYDLARERISEVRTVPLLFMDSRLMERPQADTLVELRRALVAAKAAGGAVSLLFHPETFAADPETWLFFERTLAMCSELGADLSGVLP